VAAGRKPKTLLECNLLLAVGSFLTPEQLAAGKKLPLMEQARLMGRAMPKATRVGEFVAQWTIAKYRNGTTSVDELAEMWDEPVRTMYRRLDEFREVWGPAGFDTPDGLADAIIADYRNRKERINAKSLGKLMSAEIPLSVRLPAGVTP
jgi:hypothetical protein